MDEDRMYTAVWGFLFVNTAALLTALIMIAEGVPSWPPVIVASVIAAVGNPCVVVAAWGDCIDKIVDQFLGLFKRNKEKD
jgi:hypothetical protein